MMTCDIIKYDAESKSAVKSAFTYSLTAEAIDRVEYKRNGSHKAMTLRTKAYQKNKFDLLIICTGSPFEISPTAACVPIGVRLDRPMSYIDHKLSIYTAVPLFNKEEKQLLLDCYNEKTKGVNYGTDT